MSEQSLKAVIGRLHNVEIKPGGPGALPKIVYDFQIEHSASQGGPQTLVTVRGGVRFDPNKPWSEVNKAVAAHAHSALQAAAATTEDRLAELLEAYLRPQS